MSPENARGLVEKAFAPHQEVTAVTLLSNLVVLVEVDFAKMTSFTNRKLEIMQPFMSARGYGLALKPTGVSVIIGLPDKSSPHLVPGPPPGGLGRF